MRHWGKALLLGLVVWLVPFVVAVSVFPLHEPQRPLFESIMAVTVCATAVLCGLNFLKRLGRVHVRDGVFIGFVWYAMCVLIDLPLFSYGPMKTTLGGYFADIGLTYVAIPVITIGLARAASRRGR